jgi:predicted NACHT family NTPase
MVKLDPNTINELAEILRPFVESERERQSFLIAALGNDAPVLQHISWGGSVATFIPHMMHKLAGFGGRQALCAVLEYGRSQISVHENVQQRIDQLIRQLDESASTTSEINNIDVLVQRVRESLHDDIQRLHGKIPLLGVDHQVDLGKLFVDINILEEVSSSRKLELDDLLQDFSAGVKEYSNYRSLDRMSLGKQQQRVSGLKVLAKNTNLMVLGKPGSGKTTFLQRIVNECNEGRLQPYRIPVLIKLRKFVVDCCKSQYNLERYLTQHWRLSERETELIITKGRALILLDGLDEVTGANRREISKQIKLFAHTYPQNQLIVTCRTQSQESRFEYFDYVEVADFNERQVKAFAEHWFEDVYSNKPWPTYIDINNGTSVFSYEMHIEDEKRIQIHDFLQKLYLHKNKPIYELAATPMLLSLICAVFHQTGKFYSKRSKLYEEGLELLLDKWDKLREIERDEIYRNLSLARKQELLSYLARKKFEQSQYLLFDQKEIEGYIAEFLGISQRDSRVVLKAIEVQHGLLIERTQGIYSFSHLTIQEYFTARSFVDSSKLEDLVKLAKYISDQRWWEVLHLAIGLTKSTDKFLPLIKYQIDQLLFLEPDLQELLVRINQKSCSVESSYLPAAIRAFFLYSNMTLSYIFTQEMRSNVFPPLCMAIDRHLRKENVYETVPFFKASEVNYQKSAKLTYDRNGCDFQLDMNLMVAYVRGYCGFMWVKASDKTQSPYLGSDFLDRILMQDISVSEPNINELKEHLSDLKEQIPAWEGNEKAHHEWWKVNREKWAEQLKTIIIQYRSLGYDWQLSEQQKKLLQLYYDANLLLIRGFNETSSVSPAVRKEIEETLLLPLAEIEKRQGNSHL